MPKCTSSIRKVRGMKREKKEGEERKRDGKKENECKRIDLKLLHLLLYNSRYDTVAQSNSDALSRSFFHNLAFTSQFIICTKIV